MKTLFPTATRPGVSIVTCCMDRNDFLLAALPNWLSFERVDEIIIVDWSSSAPVRETLGGFDDPRIRIARVEGEPAWILSSAYNLAARLASRDCLLKLDADVTLEDRFFEDNPLEPSYFFRGNGWQDPGLTGMAYLRREHFLAVNGYNEFLRTYGWDDMDLFIRLQFRLGLARRIVMDKTARHMPHGHASRVARHPGMIGFAGAAPAEVMDLVVERISRDAIPLAGAAGPERLRTLRALALSIGGSDERLLQVAAQLPTFHIMRNRYLCEKLEWTPEHGMASFALIDESNNQLRLARDKSGALELPPALMREAELHALAMTFFDQFPELRSAVA